MFRVPRKIRVYDRRFVSEVREKRVETGGLDFNGFLQILHQKFAIPLNETFVLATTDRTVLDYDKFEALQDGSILYLWQREDQAQSMATEEQINFTPHYDTLIRCGMYEYYASEGRSSLPYAFAELIDNALSATAKITETRTIEIRMLFDENLGKPAVIVLDNGCGMTSKQLNNWAVYRLSKFSRENSALASAQAGYIRPDPVPRSLNSDISYFGVGGKQAVFYIGNSARMISKAVGSPDVHEVVLSEEEFERKAKNNENVYSGTMKNRKPGDFSHVNIVEERFLRNLIAEEIGKESFTAVVITGVRPEHIAFLKNDFGAVTRELAHIYHYYIHGINGNNMTSNSTSADHLPNIDIQITLREKSPKCPRALSLREIDDDMQTLYITNAVDSFEFHAVTSDGGKVEGVIRYHPFLYDRETYPEDPVAVQDLDDDNDYNNESGLLHQATGKKPIFSCYWNGRLIPYSTVAEFDWCALTKRNKDSKVPAECYNRFSGVLFTDDRFQVTTNKLTFMDLELKLMKNETIFTRVLNGQKVRNIQKEFTQWLKSCHEKYDKQIEFLGYKETITRTDKPKKEQHPWATFSSIKWDKKTYTKGQLVKSLKTQPIIYGSVVRFLLHGDHKSNVFATGGEVELTLEPKALHDKIKSIPISKIDKSATEEVIKTNIDNDSAKLPEKLKVDWPDGNPWPQKAVRPAGTRFGPLKVEILNQKEESISLMPADRKKLAILLKIDQHGPKGAKEVYSHVAPHSKWAYWFKEFDNLTDLGEYTLSLKTQINESGATSFGGTELPSYKLNFTIKAGCAESFVMGAVGPSLRVGAPFDIPLLIKDHYNHTTMPPPDLKPELKCIGLDLSYQTVDSSETTLTIKNVKARGKVPKYQRILEKTFDLQVTLPGLKNDTQSVKISLLPGNPCFLHVTPEDDPILVENGNPAHFNVEIHDEAGNITAHPKKIRCQVQELPLMSIDCGTGAAPIVTKPINLKIIRGKPQKLKVQFDIPYLKNVPPVLRELKVLPSTRVSSMELFSSDNESLVLRNNEKIEWLAGGLLENLFYRLFDEAGREVPLSPEIASKIKVNWTGDVNLRNLLQGRLPDVQVPKHVHENPFYQVSYQDQSVSVSFNIVVRPDEPTQLRATLPQNSVKLGETLPGNITLELVDQYDNVTKTLTSTCVNSMTVRAEGLEQSAVSFTWQESSCSVLVTGLRFCSGSPGSREICFTYSGYAENVFVTVTAGVPAQLKLLSGPKVPLQVLNGSGIPTPFLVQLCDEWGNPSPDQRVVVELQTSPQALKVTTDVTSQPVDTEGKASFIVQNVSGPKGYYQLEFIGSFNKTPVRGPSVNLTIIPDPNKPVSLSVEYDADAKFPAGGKFPVFSVIVVSDEGSPMTIFNPANVSMLLWKGEPSRNGPPQTDTELKCSKPMENERNDRLYFRDKDIPEEVGKYTIQFSLRKDLFSNPITINVVANQPVKLRPDSQPPPPVVSYSKAVANRTLVENMTLRIMDAYGNPAGQDLGGRVAVSIMNSSGNKILPLFEGKVNRVQFSLAQGKTHITRLAIMENSPGDNGSSYILLFKPEVSIVPLDPFELPFHFSNDAENQRKMFELSRKKDELTKGVAACKEVFTTSEELLEMMTSSYLEARRKEAEQRRELNKRNMSIAETVSISDIDRLLQEKNTEAERILKTPRRVFPIRDPFKGQQDVLGMVGHLAFVQDEAAARVISWHMGANMDCVVTKTTAAAQRIYHDTQGRQQLLALDSVNVPPGNRPLPHMGNSRKLFDPPGNPVFAKELLIYSQDHENCNTVFKNLLGDTILIDDLNSGTNYRKAVAQNKRACPTILTRQGERISSRGIFGGTHNKAPPIGQLQVFGAPIPEQYNKLREQIDLLNQYRSALQTRNEREKERDTHIKEMKSPERQKSKLEMMEKKKQLDEIERQLASTPVRPAKRGPADAGEPRGFMTKRPK